MPTAVDRRHLFAAIALAAIVYLCYYRYKQKSLAKNKNKNPSTKNDREQNVGRQCNKNITIVQNHDHDEMLKQFAKLIHSPTTTTTTTTGVASGKTVTTKYDTRVIPLKPPRNDSFSKAAPYHYKFNYSDPQYDTIGANNNNNDTNASEPEPFTFKMLTFNVLASCYALKSSSYASYCRAEHLDAKHRFTAIGRILNDCDADLIALQEVDDPEQSLAWMGFHHDDNNYRYFYQKRTNKKQDGLLLAYKRNKFRLYHPDARLRRIQLNDLSLGCLSENSQTYFKKDQIAIYALLQPLHDASQVLCVVNTHLYWHPDADNIRLRQINYILNIVHCQCQNIFLQDENIRHISLLFAGDFNMLPHTSAHQFLTNGVYSMKAQGNTPLRLMMDAALNKIARWCRSLGVDCSYYSEQKLDSESASQLFEVCRRQNRILITRSKRLVARRECPAHLLLAHADARDNLKQIVKYFGIEYDDSAIYTRCTLCNGLFRELTDVDEIEQDDGVPIELKRQTQSMTFWKCLQCAQVYWFGDKSKTEVEKFRRVFGETEHEMQDEAQGFKEKLKRQILRQKRKEKLRQEKDEKNKAEKEEKENDSVCGVDEKKENEVDDEEEAYDSDIGDLDEKLRLLPNLQRFFWEDVVFEHPFGDRLECSYSSQHDGKPPHYTNKTSKFKGALDYIFYANVAGTNSAESPKLKCIESELVEGDKQFYPNSSWPSDHILLMSTFQM